MSCSFVIFRAEAHVRIVHFGKMGDRETGLAGPSGPWRDRCSAPASESYPQPTCTLWITLVRWWQMTQDERKPRGMFWTTKTSFRTFRNLGSPNKDSQLSEPQMLGFLGPNIPVDDNDNDNENHSNIPGLGASERNENENENHSRRRDGWITTRLKCQFFPGLFGQKRAVDVVTFWGCRAGGFLIIPGLLLGKTTLPESSS